MAKRNATRKIESRAALSDLWRGQRHEHLPREIAYVTRAISDYFGSACRDRSFRVTWQPFDMAPGATDTQSKRVIFATGLLDGMSAPFTGTDVDTLAGIAAHESGHVLIAQAHGAGTQWHNDPLAALVRNLIEDMAIDADPMLRHNRELGTLTANVRDTLRDKRNGDGLTQRDMIRGYWKHGANPSPAIELARMWGCAALFRCREVLSGEGVARDMDCATLAALWPIADRIMGSRYSLTDQSFGTSLDNATRDALRILRGHDQIVRDVMEQRERERMERERMEQEQREQEQREREQDADSGDSDSDSDDQDGEPGEPDADTPDTSDTSDTNSDQDMDGESDTGDAEQDAEQEQDADTGDTGDGADSADSEQDADEQDADGDADTDGDSDSDQDGDSADNDSGSATDADSMDSDGDTDGDGGDGESEGDSAGDAGDSDGNSDGDSAGDMDADSDSADSAGTPDAPGGQDDMSGDSGEQDADPADAWTGDLPDACINREQRERDGGAFDADLWREVMREIAAIDAKRPQALGNRDAAATLRPYIDRKIVDGIAREYAKLAAEPSRLRRQDAGRIDGRRIAQAFAGRGDVFGTMTDRQLDGSLVLLLDLSSSTMSHEHLIKRIGASVYTALRTRTPIKCHVYTYGRELAQLATPDRVIPFDTVRSSGGTPTAEAFAVVLSNVPIRAGSQSVIFHVTDGQPASIPDACAMMREAQRRGWRVINMFVGAPVQPDMRRVSDAAQAISRYDQLPALIGAAVAEIVKGHKRGLAG